ncbi:MAG: hypothetical protein M3P34_09995, partial [Actinomycetota bacterium]|nr:hypothetical protein [Actinomycetota bacterium]
SNGGAGGLSAVDVPGMVVAGTTSYHRPSCRLLDGRGKLATMPVGHAEEQGLSPCRVCDAGDLTLAVAEPAEAGGSRKRRGRT